MTSISLLSYRQTDSALQIKDISSYSQFCFIQMPALVPTLSLLFGLQHMTERPQGSSSSSANSNIYEVKCSFLAVPENS